MLAQLVRTVMDHRELLTAPASTTVREAAERMADQKVGAVLVVEGGRLVGIFTERDAVFRVVARGLEPRATTLAQVMTPGPITIEPDRSFGYAMLLMHENGFRHLPVVEEERTVGIVTSRNALDPDLEEFVFEERRRQHIRESK